MQTEGLQPGVAATGWGVGELCSCPQEECNIAAASGQESDNVARHQPSGDRPPGPPIYLRGARSGDLVPQPAADKSGERSLTRDLSTHARADPARGPKTPGPGTQPSTTSHPPRSRTPKIKHPVRQWTASDRRTPAVDLSRSVMGAGQSELQTQPPNHLCYIWRRPADHEGRSAGQTPCRLAKALT